MSTIVANSVSAKNKVDALKSYGYEQIYFKGNNPYVVEWGIYVYHIFALRIKKGEYLIFKERKL
jgi:hypothetical protein